MCFLDIAIFIFHADNIPGHRAAVIVSVVLYADFFLGIVLSYLIDRLRSDLTLLTIDIRCLHLGNHIAGAIHGGNRCNSVFVGIVGFFHNITVIVRQLFGDESAVFIIHKLFRFVRLKTVCSGDIVNYFLHLTVWAIVFFTGRLCNNFPLRVIICFDSRLYSIGITVLDNLTRFSRNHNALVTIGCFFGHASIRIVVYIQLPDLLSSLVVVKGSGIQLSAGTITIVNILGKDIIIGFVNH